MAMKTIVKWIHALVPVMSKATQEVTDRNILYMPLEQFNLIEVQYKKTHQGRALTQIGYKGIAFEKGEPSRNPLYANTVTFWGRGEFVDSGEIELI